MVSPIRGRLVIDINATVDQHHPRPVGSTWTHWLRYSGNILRNWKGCGAAKLASLPPTNEAFNENVARAQTGSKQPVWKLFNMVTMTTINLKLIHHCYLIYVSQLCLGHVKNVLFIDLACTSSL